MTEKRNFSLRKGLDLPISGAPESRIEAAAEVTHVAVLGSDVLGLKPKMLVQEGDEVAKGAPLFAHKDLPDVIFTAPAAGRVSAINRGARRVLQSVVIERAGDAAVDFGAVGDAETGAGVAQKLCSAGLWPALRTRPYSKIADPAKRPGAVFITAMDSEPLAADAALIIAEAPEDFAAGVAALATLTDGPTYLCHGGGAALPGAEHATPVQFYGPHPAGLPGTHIHFLHPLQGDDQVWTIWYHDVIAIGHLMRTGQLSEERIVALSGPAARAPRLLRTQVGAQISALIEGEVAIEAPVRALSGSVLSGRAAAGPEDFLGRYARQICLIEEDRKQIPLGWIRPMASKFAVQPVLGSAFARKLFPLTSNLNGGRRAMVPLGTFEELMPQDYLPTQLVRALLVMDTDVAQSLGALELDEEDLSLIAFACPAKYEYGSALRDCLTKIEKEG